MGAKIKTSLFGVSILLMVISPLDVFAIATPDHTSNNYGLREYFIGAGGEIDANSASYNLRGSIGDIGIGNSSSTNYQIYGGYTTTHDEFLEAYVDSTILDLGTLSTGSPTTATATFRVRSYLSDGYVVKNGSDPPNNLGYNMTALSTPTASSPGTEQFGINLVANTAPSSFGADPVQVPDASFSFGAASTDYDTANLYKYAKGDTVAESSQSTGRTDYTVSYLYNISNVTPGGVYIMSHNLVVAPTY